MSEYTCERCKETYEQTRPDAECWQEMYEIMPEAIDDETGVLCDDCFIEFIEWFRTLSVEEKKLMRQAYINEKGN